MCFLQDSVHKGLLDSLADDISCAVFGMANVVTLMYYGIDAATQVSMALLECQPGVLVAAFLPVVVLCAAFFSLPIGPAVQCVPGCKDFFGHQAAVVQLLGLLTFCHPTTKWP